MNFHEEQTQFGDVPGTAEAPVASEKTITPLTYKFDPRRPREHHELDASLTVYGLLALSANTALLIS